MSPLSHNTGAARRWLPLRNDNLAGLQVLHLESEVLVHWPAMRTRTGHFPETPFFGHNASAVILIEGILRT